MSRLLNQGNPIVYPSLLMMDEFRDYLRRLRQDIDNAEVNVSVTGDYTTTGLYPHEIVIVNSASPVTITLQPRVKDARVTVIREGTGGVTIDGDGSNINGASTQPLSLQYDAAELVASATQWLTM